MRSEIQTGRILLRWETKGPATFPLTNVLRVSYNNVPSQAGVSLQGTVQ